MKEKLAQIKAEAIKQIENSRTLEQLNEVRVSHRRRNCHRIQWR